MLRVPAKTVSFEIYIIRQTIVFFPIERVDLALGNEEGYVKKKKACDPVEIQESADL